MHIAVASVNGEDLAAALDGARCLLVFPVQDDAIGQPEYRPLPHAHLLKELAPGNLVTTTSAADPLRLNGNRGLPRILPLSAITGRTALSVAPETPADVPSPEFLSTVADCDVLLAGSFSPAQHSALLRLGTLCLPVPLSASALDAVRFAVSGHPPSHAASCAACPSAIKAT